jgi:hypothetical protein
MLTTLSERWLYQHNGSCTNVNVLHDDVGSRDNASRLIFLITFMSGRREPDTRNSAAIGAASHGNQI